MEREKVAATLKMLNQMAIKEIREQNYHQALNFFKQSLYLEESLGLEVSMAQSFYNLASTYFLLEEYQEAKQKIKFALILFQKNDLKQDYEKALALEEKLLDLI